MNNTIDLKRLGWVFRKDFLENGKSYLLLFLTLTGIMGVVLIWRSILLYNEIMEGAHTDVNTGLLVYASFLFPVFGILFAATIMQPMNNKIKRISYLITPSSNLEKYLSRWMIVTIGYIILFFVAFWMVDMLRVGICAARYPDLEIHFLDLGRLICPGEGVSSGNCVFYDKAFFGISFCVYLFFQSIFVLGATFWEKATFIKTFSAGVIIMLAFILLCRWAIILFYGGFEGFFSMLNSFESQLRGDRGEKGVFKFMAYVLSVFTLINWILAFFRFRESEIIKRL